jgi:RNA polymerase-binding transcription factor DksA
LLHNQETMMTRIAERKRQLEARMADLHRRMQSIEGELDSHQSKDWEEMATEREGDEVLEGIGNAAQREVRQIEAALRRIDEGEYGACAKCGTDISDERLDLLPYTPFCRDCAV